MPSPRSPSQRIKGQEVSLLMTQDGNLISDAIDVQQFEHNVEFEILEQGYLGEKGNRTDEVFNKVSGSFQLHIHEQTWFKIQSAIKDRAQRITPDTVFNLTEVFVFPNGQTPTVTFPDIKFGKQATTVSSRKDYVVVKCEFACDDYTIQQAT
jgi:hypothetical protein